MGAAASAVRIRNDLHARLLSARTRTDEVFRNCAGRCALRSSDRRAAPHYFFILDTWKLSIWNLLAQRAFGLAVVSSFL